MKHLDNALAIIGSTPTRIHSRERPHNIDVHSMGMLVVVVLLLLPNQVASFGQGAMMNINLNEAGLVRTNQQSQRWVESLCRRNIWSSYVDRELSFRSGNAFVLRARDKGKDSDSDDDDDEYNDGDGEYTASSFMGSTATNVLGTPLKPCCTNVGNSGIGTGFYRNGYCSTGEQDVGRHTVCCQVTAEFLAFSAAVGNDLSTPMPQYYFPGLRPGDIWCLCAERWVQAYRAGQAPRVFLKATHEKTLTYAPYAALRQYALDGDQADEAVQELEEQRLRFQKLME